ncbi:hypothetical protein ACFSHQ_09390 [Gemmobacter lanyuensis]
MLAKQLTYISHAESAGLVLGARVPVILNSRSDSAMSRLSSCAVAAIHHFRGKAHDAGDPRTECGVVLAQGRGLSGNG